MFSSFRSNNTAPSSRPSSSSVLVLLRASISLANSLLLSLLLFWKKENFLSEREDKTIKRRCLHCNCRCSWSPVPRRAVFVVAKPTTPSKSARRRVCATFFFVECFFSSSKRCIFSVETLSTFFFSCSKPQRGASLLHTFGLLF